MVRTPLTREPMLMAGHHEPLMFRRRGGWVRDGEEEYAREHSAGNAEELRDLGVNWVRVHYFKGFGLEAEASEMELAGGWIALLHAEGIRVETYLQFSNMMYETFLLEEPGAMSWVQRTQDGVPNRLCYGHQGWRYLMCHNSPEWEEYLRRVLRKAITEARTDQIAWDNYDINIMPDFCSCTRCQEGFRAFLSASYPDGTERRHRYGFDELRGVLPPFFNHWNPPLELRSIRDPLIQDWVSFVSQSKARALGRLNGYARSLKPDLTVNCNGIKGPTENLAFTRGLDLAGMCETTDMIGSEEHHYPHAREDGSPVTNIRTKKRCAAFGATAHNYVYERSASLRVPALALAESAAFDLVPSAFIDILERRSEGEKWRVWDFVRAHASLLRGRTSALARIALLRGSASHRHSRVETYLAALQVEQLLIENHLIFRIIEDVHLEDLSSCRLLILPGTECLGERETTLIRGHAERGGGVLCVGEVGTYDEWRRPLPAPRFGGQAGDGRGREQTWRSAHGRGTVCGVPLVPGGKPTCFDADNGNLGLVEHSMTVPRNEAQILEAIRGFGPEVCGLSVRAPRSVAVEWWEQEDGSRTIHLVSYSATSRPRGIRVEVELVPGRPFSGVLQYSPELDGPRPLGFRRRGDRVCFTVPAMDLYTVLTY